MPVLNGACTEYTCSCSGCFTGEFCEIGEYSIGVEMYQKFQWPNPGIKN